MTDATSSSGKAVGRPPTASVFWTLWAAIVVGLIALGVVAALLLPVARVGDGMEYYALFYAFTETMRPWMNATSFAAYEQLHQSGHILGTLGLDYLQAAFPALRLGDTADFNHFWFYSFLAALIQAPLALIGLHIGPHASFVLLHALLFAGLMFIAARCYGWAGVWTVIILTLGSPILWYFNKVHTEFLTYCVTLAAIILAMRNQMIAGALLMAVAATQNPGLSFVPVVMIALRGLSDWNVSYSRWEVMGAVLAILLLALHPAYYFLRFEVITPQILAGGASPGGGLSIAYIWLFDPDVGLFPNWGLGLVLLVLGVIFWRKACSENPGLRPENAWHFWITVAVFIAAALYSHASTENINSGATPGLARYALWYIPLVYPAVLAVVVTVMGWPKQHRRFATAALSVGVVATSLTVLAIIWESYTTPSVVSRLVQTYTPWLYNPPPPIFAVRFAHVGSDNMYAASAVVGPDCRKIVLIPPPGNSEVISVPDECPFIAEQISGWVSSELQAIVTPTYFNLEATNIAPRDAVALDYRYGHNFQSSAIKLTGWSAAEQSHRWSDEPRSGIEVVLPPSDGVGRCMAIDGFTYGTQTITAFVDGTQALEVSHDGEIEISVPLGRSEGETRVEFAYSDPKMPPNDNRLIAFGLRSFIVGPCPPT